MSAARPVPAAGAPRRWSFSSSLRAGLPRVLWAGVCSPALLMGPGLTPPGMWTCCGAAASGPARPCPVSPARGVLGEWSSHPGRRSGQPAASAPQATTYCRAWFICGAVRCKLYERCERGAAADAAEDETLPPAPWSGVCPVIKLGGAGPRTAHPAHDFQGARGAGQGLDRILARGGRRAASPVGLGRLELSISQSSARARSMAMDNRLQRRVAWTLCLCHRGSRITLR